MMLVGLAMAVYIVQMAAAVIGARAMQRMANAIEDHVTVEEMRMLEAENDEQTEVERPTARGEENKKPLLMRKGAQHIDKRRAEAGF